MFGLISPPDPRYGGAPDPDEERERRWEPINWRISGPLTLSLLCLICSGVAHGLVNVLLNLAAVALCAYAMRVAWPPRREDERDAPDVQSPPRPRAARPSAVDDAVGAADAAGALRPRVREPAH